MSKKVLSLVLALCMVLTLLPTTVFAADNNKATYAESHAWADAAAEQTGKYDIVDDDTTGTTITLKDDIVLTAFVQQNGGTLTIDLAGHNLTRKDNAGTVIATSGTGKLTITNSGTEGQISGKDAFIVAQEGGTITIKAKIEQTEQSEKNLKDCAIYAQNGGNVIIEAGAEIIAKAAIMVSDVGTNSLTMTGGKITAESGAIYTNGTSNSTADYSDKQTIKISGGTIESKSSFAIYLPGKGGDVAISGTDTTITGANTGIDMRAGKLTVEGGTISGGKGTASTGTTPSVGGGVVSNAGIGVAPYANQTVDVTIKGGTISGGTAFYQDEEQNVNGGAYTFEITGGTFEGTNKAVESSKVTKFIKGGTFKDGGKPADIKAYLADNLTLNSNGEVVDGTGTLSFELATAKDTSDNGIENPVVNPKIVTTYDNTTNTYTVHLTADEVKYHKNGVSEGGYWIGFYIEAPEAAATKVKDSYFEELQDLEAIGGKEDFKDYAVYYDLSDWTTDEFTLQFYAGGNPVGGNYTINVDLTGAKTDDMDFSEAGFTYNKDANIVEDCDIETMYVKFTDDYKTGKYIVTVTGPNGYKADYYAANRTAEQPKEIGTLAWSFNNSNQSDGKGVIPGTYTFRLYTYTGGNIDGTQTITVDKTTGVPTLADHEFEAIGTTQTVSVTDAITTVKVTKVETNGSTEASKAVVTADATVSGRDITITGSATGLADNETIDVTLTLGNDTDDTAGEVKVTIAKDAKSGAYKVTKVEGALAGTEGKPETFKLLTKGEPFTVKSEITVVDVEIADAGKTEVKTDGLTEDEQTKLNGYNPGESTKIAPDDNNTQKTIEKLVTEAVADNEDKLNASEAANQLNAVAGIEDVTADDVKFFVQPHLNLEITGYSAPDAAEGVTANKTLSVEISAVYDLVATKDGTASNLTADNSVKIEENLPLTVSEPIKLTVGLPTGFTTDGTIYVKHTKDGGTAHYHQATVATNVATFTSTDGLSPFVFESNAKPVASIGTGDSATYYETLQEAVNAVPDKGTVTLLENCEDDVYVSRVMTFTLDVGTYAFSGTIIAGTGYNVSEVKNSDGSTTYTVTYTGSGVNPTYTVTVPANPNGTVSVSPKSATAGTTITVTVTPKEGYSVDTVTVTQNGTGTAVTVTKNADGTYSFTMPAGGATVKATFVEGEKVAPSAKFTDVVKDAWYVDAIDYVVEKGLMNGIGETTFAPNDQTDRAMLVTILYRLDGEPAVTKDIPFSDVPAGKWYSDAINWAAANEIVGGYGDGTFRPDRDLTREEAATILYRYATYKKYDVTTTAELTAYTDAASVQSYATASMSWAVGTELINGTTATTLAPNGGAIRAQIATILMRFCENIVK